MSDDLARLWVYLAADPLLWLTLTLVAYQGGLWLHRRFAGNPLLNPVLVAVLLLPRQPVCWVLLHWRVASGGSALPRRCS